MRKQKFKLIFSLRPGSGREGLIGEIFMLKINMSIYLVVEFNLRKSAICLMDKVR